MLGKNALKPLRRMWCIPPKQSAESVCHVEPRGSPDIADRLEIHHTPKHGSWLNMAEIEPSALSRDLPDRVAGKATLERHVAAWQRRRNTATTKVDWRFTIADARIKLRKLYPTTDS